MFEALILGAGFLAFFLPVSPVLQMLLCAGCLLLAMPGVRAGLGGAPFVPTRGPTMKRMMEWADIKPGEHVVDIGCGDGRFIVAAARAGARAVGYELSLPLYALCAIRTAPMRNCSVKLADLWKQRYDTVDVLLCFQTKETMKRVERDIWPQLKPGAKLISHAFSMPGVTPTKKDRDVVMYVK